MLKSSAPVTVLQRYVIAYAIMANLRICEGSSNVERFLLFKESSAAKLQKIWLSRCKTVLPVDQKIKNKVQLRRTGAGKPSHWSQQSDGAETGVVVTTDDGAENNTFTFGTK